MGLAGELFLNSILHPSSPLHVPFVLLFDFFFSVLVFFFLLGSLILHLDVGVGARAIAFISSPESSFYSVRSSASTSTSVPLNPAFALPFAPI